MSLGPMELALLLGLAVLVFGPSRLPGLGRSLGDAIRGFKKGMDGEEEDPKKDKAKEQIASADTESKTAAPEKEKNKV